MTKVRHLLGVMAGLALAVWCGSSWLQGQSGGGKKAPALDIPASLRPNLPPLTDATPAEVQAETRFSQTPLITFQPAAGETMFALQLKPKLNPIAPRPRDYLVMVSTSATQAGSPWFASNQIAEAIVKDAKGDDRISLWTVSTPEETATRCLTRDFLSAKEDLTKLQSHLRDLRKKYYPAGDTDLKTALTKAIESFDNVFDGNGNRQRILLFLGDGLSTHNAITAEDRQKFCQDMVKRRIAFFTVPLGIQLSAETLHGLATGTGGMVLRTNILHEQLPAAMKRYQEAFAGPILYDPALSLPATVSEYYPRKLPPLRADVPTLVVGRIKEGKTLDYSVQGNVGGGPAGVTLNLAEALPETLADHYFLATLLNQWKNAQTQPALIRADRALALAYEQNRLQHQELILEAQAAIEKNEYEAAARLFDQARQLAPHDAEAAAGLKVVDQMRSGKLTRDTIRQQLNKQNQKVAAFQKVNGKLQWQKGTLLALLQEEEKQPAKIKDAPAEDREDLLRARRDAVIVEEQKMTQTVEEALQQARRELTNDPDAALDKLRTTLARLRDHPDLGDRVRDALVNRLQAALRDVATQGRSIKIRKQEQQDIIAVVKKQLDEQQQRKTIQERTEAQFNTFKGMLNMARYEEKTKQEVLFGLMTMNREAHQRGDASPMVLRAAYDQTLASYNLQKYKELRWLREQRFLSVLLEVEKSHVPFPDEPGIYYPPLATWKAISELRKDRYEVSAIPDDFQARKEALSVSKLLTETIDMKDFQNQMTLKEFIGILYEKFASAGKELPIVVHGAAFKDENPDEFPEESSIYENTQVKFPAFLKKMQLATILRLALSQVKTGNATYIIRRNFIEITTTTVQQKDRVLRVYPVGELVVPFNVNQMMGGGMMGGMGGMMGGMGGMMGGMGGMGMGMPGMGMGGMGMGMPGMGMGGMGMGMPGMGMGGMGMPGMGMGGMGMGMPGMGMGGMGMGGMGGMGMPGMMGLGMGGQLGMITAPQAMDLIQTVTRLVAPGEWFYTQQQQVAMNPFMAAQLAQQIGQANNPFAGMFNPAGQVPGAFAPGAPGGGGPPTPVAEGGPADVRDSNTIEFFAPALALIVRAPSRIHTSITGGIIGGKIKKAETGMFDLGDGRVQIAGREKRGPQNIAKVGNAGDKKDPKNVVQVAQGRKVNMNELDPTKCWQEALEKGGVDAGLVIATADFLFENGFYVHAAEFLKANLRLGIVVRPWVFEALAIALEASGADPVEVRRARLSGVALDPQDAGGVLKAARAMAEHKQWDRALAFCRQAAVLEPNLVQSYAEALNYAELGKDSQAMEWAVGRLLSQDWPVDNQAIQLKAQVKLEGLARVLEKDRRQQEAAKLREALLKLRQRDLVINLTWEAGTEPADLDLEIKEPCGSVCNSEQRQTPGGGTLLGNHITDLTRASYMAAQAFTGEYEIKVRRNWGQPLGSRARLEIIQHLGTPQERRRLEIIRLDQLRTVKVNVVDGRRTSLATVPPPAMQKPRTASAVAANGGSPLAKLRELVYPDYTGKANTIRGSAGITGATLPIDPTAAARKTDRPTFQTSVTPMGGSGLNLTARAELSADQRFMRLSVQPVFQTVGKTGTPVHLPGLPGAP